MAKFTRTAYASGSLGEIAHEIADLAGVRAAPGDEPFVALDTLHTRSAHGRKRVRITILVEPEKAPPKRAKAPRRPRQVQGCLPLEQALGSLLEGTKYAVPASAVLGGAS